MLLPASHRRRSDTWLSAMRARLCWRYWKPAQHPQLGEFLDEQFKATNSAVRWAMVIGALVLVLRGFIDTKNGTAAPLALEMGWRLGSAAVLVALIFLFSSAPDARRGQRYMGLYVIGLVASICGTLHLHYEGREASTLIPLVLVFLLSTALWTSSRYLAYTLIISATVILELFVNDVIPSMHQRTYIFYLIVGTALGFVLRHGRLQTAFDNFLLRRHLAAQALSDPLTGILNRSGWENRLVGTLKGGCPPRPSCLLFFDLDHFKRVNDVHGHAVGDMLIRQAAAIITRGLRESDVLARFGGEEFVVFLPATAQREGLLVAERIRGLVEASIDPVPMTVSIGLAEFKPGETIEMAMDRADHALLDAKASGRNRVVAASV